MIKISCIIPAWNEGPRIAAVLSAVVNHPLLHEVIVVDDFSTDNTREIAKSFPGVRLLSHTKNVGKSQAVVTGLKESSGDYIFFLDADLVGLDSEAVSLLAEPVISGYADISISLRRELWLWRLVGVDFLSGERIFPKKLLSEHIEDILKLPRFGLESFMNKLIIAGRYKIKIVLWENVFGTFKYKKEGFFMGMKSDVKMVSDIFKTASLKEIIGQIYELSKLKIR